MKKITTKGVTIGIAICLISGLVIATFVAGGSLGFFRTVPKPEIKEGEFNFALTYEVDGTTEKIEGTYVCKFKGVYRALDGIGRRWTGYIKGHEDSNDYIIKETDEGTIWLNPDISADFFMADPNYKLSENTDDPKPEPYLYITSGDPTIEDPANEVFFSDYEGDDVKIISFEYDEPIENIYK